MAKKKNQKNNNSNTNKQNKLDTKEEVKDEVKVEENAKVQEESVEKKDEIKTEEKVEVVDKPKENEKIDDVEIKPEENKEVPKEEKIPEVSGEEKKEEIKPQENVENAIKQENPPNDTKVVERIIEKVIIREVEPKKKNIFIRMISFVVSRVMFLLFMVLVFVISVQMAIYIFDKRANEKICEEIVDISTQQLDESVIATTGVDINFAGLKEKNSNTVAWLKINNVKVNFPIVKEKDNEFYLKHNFYKALNSSGWIFMDFSNKFDGTDKNVVIYGKDCKDGTLFGDLKNVLKDEWLYTNDSKIITLTTPVEKMKYEVFSVYKIDFENDYSKTFFAEGEFDQFIETMKSRSVRDFGTSVANTDTLLTISTLSDDGKEKIVIHAKKVIGQ